MRAVVPVLALFLLLAAGCGGSDPEAEATWETHTTADDGSAGGEAEGGSEAGEDAE